MLVRRIALFLVLLTGLALPALAAQDKPVPPGGTPLLPAGGTSAFTITGSAEAVEMQTVPVTGQPFTQALRLRTRTKTPLIYSVQIAARPTAPVKQGDVALATFYVRALEGQPETGEAQTQFVFERSTAPHTKSATHDVSVPKNAWHRIDVPFRVVEDGAPEGTNINFRLGYNPQVIEIGGISLVNYGASVELSSLPRTKATYRGREKDAPWRKAAQERIEKIRKADLKVLAFDKSGKPVRDAVVAVRMKRHAFAFGSAVAAQGLLGDGPDDRKYQEMVASLFNQVVMENDLKWPQWEEDAGRAKQGVAWLRQRGIEVRGHNLIWPSWRNMPANVQSLKDDKAALKQRIETHIREEATAMRGHLVDWDVINEPFDNHDAIDILGREAMITWFKIAREADPGARLFLNDYPPLDGGDATNAHLNSFEANLRFLKDSGAPLDGIGFQCHFGGSVIAPERLLSGLDRFGALGLPIVATEFDINMTDEELQADYLRDFMTTLFSHPRVDGIIMWGFWEGRHWMPNAALWRRDWSIKPSGQAWLDLVQNTWWTNADGKTDRRGAYATRAFHGAYEVTVTKDGKTRTARPKLTPGGATVAVILD